MNVGIQTTEINFHRSHIAKTKLYILILGNLLKCHFSSFGLAVEIVSASANLENQGYFAGGILLLLDRHHHDHKYNHNIIAASRCNVHRRELGDGHLWIRR